MSSGITSVEGRPLDDVELAERAKGGDVDAYEALVANHQALAFRVAFLITRDQGEAQDAAQDAFVRAYYALDTFRSGSSFKPWLLRIVANQARNRRRSAGRRLELATRVGESRPSGDAAPSPEAAALHGEARAELLEALDELRDEERLAVIYRYFLDLNEAEMAEALGCRPGTVKSRLSRALMHLRSRLDRASVSPQEEVRA